VSVAMAIMMINFKNDVRYPEKKCLTGDSGLLSSEGSVETSMTGEGGMSSSSPISDPESKIDELKEL